MSYINIIMVIVPSIIIVAFFGFVVAPCLCEDPRNPTSLPDRIREIEDEITHLDEQLDVLREGGEGWKSMIVFD